MDKKAINNSLNNQFEIQHGTEVVNWIRDLLSDNDRQAKEIESLHAERDIWENRCENALNDRDTFAKEMQEWRRKARFSGRERDEARQANAALLEELDRSRKPRPLEEWHEDYGSTLWWKFPIEEPPYCGTPLDSDWPDYHTHWTAIIDPQYDTAPKEDKESETSG